MGRGSNLLRTKTFQERRAPSFLKGKLLEKKRDYKQRTDHYKKEQARIGKLREQAYFANPDEYTPQMDARVLINGKMRLREDVFNNKDSHDKVAWAAVADAKFVDAKRNTLLAQRQRIRGNLATPGPTTHIVFSDVDEEPSSESELEGDDLDDLVNRIRRRRRLEQGSSLPNDRADAEQQDLEMAALQHMEAENQRAETIDSRLSTVSTVQRQLKLKSELMGWKRNHRRVRKTESENGSVQYQFLGPRAR